MERLSYIPPLCAYGVLAFAHLLPGVVPGWLEKNARALGITGVALHVVALGIVAGLGHVTPGVPEALSAAALGSMLAYVIVGAGRLRVLGLLLAPLSLVLLATSLFVPHQTMKAISETGSSAWLPLHLALTFSGFAGFTLAFAVGIAYLFVRDRLKRRKLDAIGRLPPLEVLDRIQFRSMLFGFVFLTLGIGVGGVWAAVALPEPWLGDPKVWFSFVVWAWYGIALQVRLVAGLRGRWSALFSIAGFVGMVFSLLAVNLLLSGFHGYGR